MMAVFAIRAIIVLAIFGIGAIVLRQVKADALPVDDTSLPKPPCPDFEGFYE